MLALAEAMAQELVDQVEEAAPEEGTGTLGSRVNAATKKVCIRKPMKPGSLPGPYMKT